MKHTSLILMLAACTLAASAQTPAPPAAPAAKPATTATTPAKPATAAAKSATTAATPAATPAKPGAPAVKPAPAAKLPLGVPAPGMPPVKTIKKVLTTATLSYQDIKVGTGAVAEPGKLYKIFYTGYRASDGVIFDSTNLHPRPPVLGKDGKPELGEDGKPKQGPPQPMSFPQGTGGTIIGFDQGFAGMKVGGQRRIFIPWQMGYGTRTMPDRGVDHPGIPAKSDLIFDVELVDVTDVPPQQARPGMRPGAGGQQMPPRPGAPGAPGAPMQMTVAPKPAAAPAPGTAPSAAAPATPAAPAAPAATAPAAPSSPAQPPAK